MPGFFFFFFYNCSVGNLSLFPPVLISSISWKHQYIQSLQKNDVIIKFLCSGIYSTLIYWVCQILKKNCLLCCPWGCLNKKCPFVYLNALQSFGKAMNLWHMEPCWEKHGIGAVGFCNFAQILGLSFCLFPACRWNVTSKLPVACVPHHGRFSSASIS